MYVCMYSCIIRWDMNSTQANFEPLLALLDSTQILTVFVSLLIERRIIFCRYETSWGNDEDRESEREKRESENIYCNNGIGLGIKPTNKQTNKSQFLTYRFLLGILASLERTTSTASSIFLDDTHIRSFDSTTHRLDGIQVFGHLWISGMDRFGGGKKFIPAGQPGIRLDTPFKD